MEYKWNVILSAKIIIFAHLLINKNHFSNFYIYLIQNHY